jgi:hypothetical protein
MLDGQIGRLPYSRFLNRKLIGWVFWKSDVFQLYSGRLSGKLINSWSPVVIRMLEKTIR